MAISRITAFNPSVDDIDSWTMVLQNFLIASGIDKSEDDQKAKATAILLSSIGVSTYTLLKDLVSPEPPESMLFDDLVTVLVSHYKPAPKAISERYKFYNRRQQPGETVTVFLSELRKLAVTCKFEKLEISLRDQFVVGLSTEAAQKMLFLEDDDLKLDEAVKIAISQEAADASTKLIRQNNQQSLPLPTNKVSTSKGSRNQNGDQKNSSSSSGDSGKSCFGCVSKKHISKDCPHKEVECFKCHNKGHYAKFCSKLSGKQKGNKVTINNVNEKQPPPPAIFIQVLMNGRFVNLEWDTGATRTIISHSVWIKLGSPQLKKSSVKFKTYTGEDFEALGTFDCELEYNGQKVNHDVFVTVNSDSCLFGRDLLYKLQMDWPRIKKQCLQVNNLSVEENLKSLLEEFKDVFDEPVGTVKNFKAKLIMKEEAVPKFCKARPVPYALREKVDAELKRMEDSGVITRVEHSEWASPLVVVPKSNGRVRITGDFKRTINSQLCVNQYPLARMDDLMETISGGNTFSKLDGSDAFHQVEVEENFRKYLVINTHRGLFRYNVLPQGIASSPAIFQEMMDMMLRGIEKTGSFVDDAITSGSNDQQHLSHLRQTLTRMREANYRLSRSKCEFMKKSVKFLGYVVCKEGIRTDPEKIEAILEMKQPENTAEVSSFLGLVNFYGKFIPHLSTLCEPLFALTKKDIKFEWSRKCDIAFNKVKQFVSTSPVLEHYSQNVPVGIACDASSVGAGVVLFHRYPDGTEKPIAYASKTLTQAERNYSQIEKEGLSIIFGLKKFMKYLYGRRFILITDHAPLLAIFGDKRDVPALVATRLHRWALLLSGYTFDIEYRSTHAHGNADALSRLPVPTCDEVDEEANETVKRIKEENPLTTKKVRYHTSRDPVLSQVIRFVQSGWPEKLSQIPEDVKPFFSHRFEYGVEQGIVMWGIRVVVPLSLRPLILDQLHDTHPGIVRMKSLARQFVWWPGIDADIEAIVKSCHSCCVNRDNPATAPLHPWSFPEKPWQRIHIDFAGPFLDKMWLIIVDAHSKWPEVIDMGKDTTSRKVIIAMRNLIARFGIPDVIVSDNGPQFVSSEFEAFCLNNGIRHAKSSAYHPRSNGEAERFVRTFKNGLSHCSARDDLNLALCDFLLAYRITPHATTGVSPSELLLKRKPRTLLDLIRPDAESVVRANQEKQVEHHSKTNLRQFEIGHAVWIRTFGKNDPSWSLGKVVKIPGPVTYIVDIEGRTYKRHVDHILDGEIVKKNPVGSPAPDQDEDYVVAVPLEPDEEEDVPDEPEEPERERRYPVRNRRAPVRYPLN